MDVQSREALEELRSALRLFGMELPCLPLAVPQYVSFWVSLSSWHVIARSVLLTSLLGRLSCLQFGSFVVPVGVGGVVGRVFIGLAGLILNY